MLAWLVLGAVAGTVLVATSGDPAGARALTVLSGSMRPTLDVGDLIVIDVVEATDLATGGAGVAT